MILANGYILKQFHKIDKKKNRNNSEYKLDSFTQIPRFQFQSINTNKLLKYFALLYLITIIF